MSRLFLATALSSLLLATTAFAALDMVSSIDVTVDLPAITNKAAALRYSNIADDLKSAITSRLVDRLAEDGMKVSVDISEVELSNSFTETVGSADTRLVGIVSITDVADNSNFKSYTLSVDVNQAKTFFPATVDLATLTASSEEYYQAMIHAFAQVVVDRLEN